MNTFTATEAGQFTYSIHVKEGTGFHDFLAGLVYRPIFMLIECRTWLKTYLLFQTLHK